MPDFSKMPEAFLSSANLATAVSREVQAGRLRKVGSRLYTRDLKDPPEKIVQRNLWPLVAAYLPAPSDELRASFARQGIYRPDRRPLASSHIVQLVHPS
jgi:hypothetical protein